MREPIGEAAVTRRGPSRRRQPAEAVGEYSCSTRPNQNTGSEMPANEITERARANARLTAGRCPAGPHGQREHEREADQLERRRHVPDASITGRPSLKLKPQSPMTSSEPLQVLLPERLIEAERAGEALEILGPDARLDRYTAIGPPGI